MPHKLRTRSFRLFIYRNWIGEGMSMNDNEGNILFIYSSRPFWCGWSQMPIRVWHGDIEFGEWLTGDGGTLDISSLDNDSDSGLPELSVPSTEFGLSVFIEGDTRTLVGGFLCWCFVSTFFPLCFDFSSLLWRDKRVLSEELLSRGLKLFSGKTFCNHIKVLVGSPI